MDPPVVQYEPQNRARGKIKGPAPQGQRGQYLTQACQVLLYQHITDSPGQQGQKPRAAVPS